MIQGHELETAYLSAVLGQIETPSAVDSLQEMDVSTFGSHVVRVALGTLHGLVVTKGLGLSRADALRHVAAALDDNDEARPWLDSLDLNAGFRADLEKLGGEVSRVHATREAEAILGASQIRPGHFDADMAAVLTKLSEVLSKVSDDRWRAESLSPYLDQYARGEAVIPPDMADSIVVFGHPDLDDPEEGIIASRGTLGVISAPPTWGKSAAVSQIAAQTAYAGRHILVTSLEQNREQLAMRSIASLMGALKGHVKRGGHPRQVDDVSRAAAARIRMLNPGSGTEWFRIEAAARRLHRLESLDVLIVDYFTLLEPPNIGKQFSSAAMFGWISKAAKSLAQQLNIAVILVAQFSRKMEHIDQEPEPSDLKETSQLEQDADWIWFMWATPKKDGLQPQHHEQNRVSAWKKAKNRWGKVDFTGNPRYLEIDPARDMILTYTRDTDAGGGYARF